MLLLFNLNIRHSIKWLKFLLLTIISQKTILSLSIHSLAEMSPHYNMRALSLPPSLSITTERERKLLWCQPVFIVTTPSWPILQVPLKLPQVIQEQHNHIEDEPTGGVAAPSASSSTTTTEPEWRETDTPIIKPWLHLFCNVRSSDE